LEGKFLNFVVMGSVEEEYQFLSEQILGIIVEGLSRIKVGSLCGPMGGHPSVSLSLGQSFGVSDETPFEVDDIFGFCCPQGTECRQLLQVC
jgi:hypothetical protein